MIRPFHINISEEALIDLRKRIEATKFPERETVTDASQGVQLRRYKIWRVIGRLSTTGISAKRN